jgi:hypothetical protein
MRNVLVHPSGGVTVLDTLARRHAPVYEDVATFAVDMRSSRPQLYSFGLAFATGFLREMEDSIRRGHDPAGDHDATQLKVYEMLVLLDRWAALLDRYPRGRRRLRPIHALANRWYERELRTTSRLLSDLGRAGRAT